MGERQVRALKQESGPGAPRCPAAPEEGPGPILQVGPAPQKLESPGGLRKRTRASGGSNTSEADKDVKAGRPNDSVKPDLEEKCVSVRLVDSAEMFQNDAQAQFSPDL